MLIEQEIGARRERAQGAVTRILARPAGGVYGDYQIRSSSNSTYRVAMRGPGLFDNDCSCPDFAINTLGTCKHIEALLLRLRRRHSKAFDGKFSRMVRLLGQSHNAPSRAFASRIWMRKGTNPMGAGGDAYEDVIKYYSLGHPTAISGIRRKNGGLPSRSVEQSV